MLLRRLPTSAVRSTTGQRTLISLSSSTRGKNPITQSSSTTSTTTTQDASAGVSSKMFEFDVKRVAGEIRKRGLTSATTRDAGMDRVSTRWFVMGCGSVSVLSLSLSVSREIPHVHSSIPPSPSTYHHSNMNCLSSSPSLSPFHYHSPPICPLISSHPSPPACSPPLSSSILTPFLPLSSPLPSLMLGHNRPPPLLPRIKARSRTLPPDLQFILFERYRDVGQQIGCFARGQVCGFEVSRCSGGGVWVVCRGG